MVAGRSLTEHCTVKVQDITEFPTELGTRCLLLQELGLNPYSETEEVLLEALTESAGRPSSLDICLGSSRCRKFFQVFQEGLTPFADRDPIRLLEYGGKYWAVEGKHRVCLAKRSGVEALEAEVYHLAEDSMPLLPPVGEPGRFSFRFSCIFGPRGAEEVSGETALLWVKHPGLLLGTFGFGHWVQLGPGRNTAGEWEEVLPGVHYRVSVEKKLERQAFFRRREVLTVESEVEIAPEHPKTKIWLLGLPAKGLMGLAAWNSGPPRLTTVYRRGCWRKHHARQLECMYFRFF